MRVYADSLVSRGALCFLLLLLFLFPNIILGQGKNEAQLVEIQVKASFIHNFAYFVEWPETAFSSPNDPFRIGIVGDSFLADLLRKTVQGKNVKSRPFLIESFSSDSVSIDDLKSFQILFFRNVQSATPLVGDVKLSSLPILTIGNDPGFTTGNGIIDFFSVNDRISFEVNPGNSQKAGLKISSKLLKLARIVGEPQNR